MDEERLKNFVPCDIGDSGHELIFRDLKDRLPKIENKMKKLERSLVALSNVLAVPRRELEENLDAWASHDWCADPFARGAYSYIGVNGIRAPRALGHPVESTLLFAGEATNGAEIGTVAGALSSGRRAAREVLRVLHG